jgi:hypothetical protein
MLAGRGISFTEFFWWQGNRGWFAIRLQGTIRPGHFAENLHPPILTHLTETDKTFQWPLNAKRYDETANPAIGMRFDFNHD